MQDALEQPETRPEVLSALRELAAHGASVRPLTDEIRNSLNYHGDSALPFLWYFTQAFALSLPEVLPLREWLEGGNDDEIDALLLPRIVRGKARWMPERTENGETKTASGSPGNHGLTAAKQRG